MNARNFYEMTGQILILDPQNFHWYLRLLPVTFVAVIWDERHAF